MENLTIEVKVADKKDPLLVGVVDKQPVLIKGLYKATVTNDLNHLLKIKFLLEQGLRSVNSRIDGIGQWGPTNEQPIRNAQQDQSQQHEGLHASD